MSTASTGSESAATTPRLNRPILVSNLVSGMLCQLLLVALGSWPLAVIGAGYIVVGSMILAAAYGRETLTPQQEIGSWAVTWLLAVALWAWIFFAPDILLSGLFGAFAIGTVCFLVWQLLALAVRQLLVSRRLSA